MIQADAADADLRVSPIEREDFDWIVVQHQKQIYRVLQYLVRDADAAEILTQECFLRAFQKRGSYRGESNLGTWLVRIAINMAHDHNRNRRWAFWRKLKHTDRIEDLPMTDLRHSPEQALIANESANSVWGAVDRLSERQKTVFLLRFVEDMPLEAIAEAMDLEIGTVKTHLFRAIGAVRTVCAKRNK